MSRNLRQKFPRTPTKVAKRRGKARPTTPTNLSDDDGYSGVDEISDSEDDEENVDAAEEEHIISRESHPRRSHSPRPQSESDEEEDDDDDQDGDADQEDEDGEDEDADLEAASWGGIVSDEDGNASSTSSSCPTPVTPRTKRQVRFVDVPSSDSDSTDTDDDHGDFFPDIFVEQSALDPAFRREVERDVDDSSQSSAFWDFHDPAYDCNGAAESDLDATLRHLAEDFTPTATPVASQEVPTEASTPVQFSDDSQELDGYESDGDTTEEDEPEPPAKRKERRLETETESSDSDANRIVKFRPGKPRIGSFDLEPNGKKPIAVVNPITGKMMIFTPPQLQQMDLSPEQFSLHFWSNADDASSPILSNSGGLMMGAMFSSHTFGDFMNTHAIGPAEAFFPLGDECSDSSVEDAPEDEAERNLDITDFITCDSSEDEDNEDGANGWGEESETPDTPRPVTASSETELLAHLTSETVGSFRRNQLNQQLIFSNKATPDSLAFSGPLNHTALRGLKLGRFQSATAPLTPIRRHKRHSSDLLRSPLEPISQKRKASAEHSFGHKRQRSISDVNLLRI